MKKWLPKSVDDLIDKLDKSKHERYYSLEVHKGDDEIIFNKNDGDIWIQDGIEYTIVDGILQSTKSKILDDEIKDIKLPRFCPICKKKLEHVLDIDSWWINEKCYDCFIAEDNLLRIKKDYKNISKLKNIKETIVMLKAEMALHEELLNIINRKLLVVENSDGKINEWITEQSEIKGASEELSEKIIGMKKYIDELNKEKEKYE